MKTKDCIKNEPETNRNEPENEAGQVAENTGSPKTGRKPAGDCAAMACAGQEHPLIASASKAMASAPASPEFDL